MKPILVVSLLVAVATAQTRQVTTLPPVTQPKTEVPVISTSPRTSLVPNLDEIHHEEGRIEFSGPSESMLHNHPAESGNRRQNGYGYLSGSGNHGSERPDYGSGNPGHSEVGRPDYGNGNRGQSEVSRPDYGSGNRGQVGRPEGPRPDSRPSLPSSQPGLQELQEAFNQVSEVMNNRERLGGLGFESTISRMGNRFCQMINMFDGGYGSGYGHRPGYGSGYGSGYGYGRPHRPYDTGYGSGYGK